MLGVPIAVVYKFFDDQGNFVAATLTYYAFVAIFPLLLLASSILGFILQGNPDLKDNVLNSALGQFPIIGDQLSTPEGLQGSATAVVVGSLAALYGSLGLGQGLQHAMHTAWSVPRNSRPNPFLLRLKSLLLLVTAGAGVLGVSIFSAVGSSTGVFSERIDSTIRALIPPATVLIVGSLLTLLFRVAAAHRHTFQRAAPGAFALAVMWQGLQYVGALYATRVLAETSSLNNRTFGLVLGLIGIIYVAAVMGMLGIEINVVLERRLWPRALLTPFTDSVELTDADRRAYALYAKAQRHKGFERVQVEFDDPTTGEIVIPDAATVEWKPRRKRDRPRSG